MRRPTKSTHNVSLSLLESVLAAASLSKLTEKDYRAWASLALNDQYDNNKNGAIRLEIARGRLDLLELHQFLIQVNSPDVVVLDNSLFELEVDYAPYRDR